MSIWNDFKQFISRGNVIDLGIAVVIGAAFNRIVTSFVNDILMPPVGILLDGIDFNQLQIILKPGDPPVAIRYGLFINAIISFLIIGFSVFLVVKGMAKLHRKREEQAKTKMCPDCCLKIPVLAKKCGHCGLRF